MSTRRWWWMAPALVLAASLTVLGSGRNREGTMVVEAGVENFREAPGGRKLGTLLQGVEIETLATEGRWVRFRVEGWVWGPSLAGFEQERPRERAVSPPPHLPLQDAEPRIKRLIDERDGIFYSLELDEDLQRLTIRFRVRAIEREALESRQMAVQALALELLEGKLEFTAIRVMTNRPEGTGPVGVEIAQTEVEEVRRYARAEREVWKAHSRISQDGGETWLP